MRSLLSLFLLIAIFAQPSFSWYYTYNGVKGCAPQKTPLNGEKWCKYKSRANELGSICWFTCNEGHRLSGPTVNECVSSKSGKSSRFNVTGTKCEYKDASGPFFIFPAALPNYHFSRDSRYRLVLTQDQDLNPPKMNIFYVQTPGLNNDTGTVSFYSAADPDFYVVKQAQSLYVFRKSLTHPLLGGWNEVTTFFVRKDKFRKDYVALESVQRPTLYIMYNDANEVTLQWSSRPEFNATRASFSWKKATPTV